jgi:hypothetical protein
MDGVGSQEFAELFSGADREYFDEIFSILQRPLTRPEFRFALRAGADGIPPDAVACSLRANVRVLH